MIRDEVLGLSDQLSDLAGPPVAASEMAQKLPAQWVRDELQELERRCVGSNCDHVIHNRSSQIDTSI